MHLAPIVSDKQQDERVLRSRPTPAMGADGGWRGGEVVVDPLCDEVALFSLALAQHSDDVELAAAEDSDNAGRRWRVGLKGEIIAVECDSDAVVAGKFERLVDRHSRTLQPEFSSLEPRAPRQRLSSCPSCPSCPPVLS